MNCIEQGRQKGLRLKELKEKRRKEEQYYKSKQKNKKVNTKKGISIRVTEDFIKIFEALKKKKKLSSSDLLLSVFKNLDKIQKDDINLIENKIESRVFYIGYLEIEKYDKIKEKAEFIGFGSGAFLEILIKKEYPQYFKV